MIKLGRMYLHEKSNVEYLVQHVGRVNVNGKWVDSVSYMNNMGDMYTRTLTDFNENLTLITCDCFCVYSQP